MPTTWRGYPTDYDEGDELPPDDMVLVWAILEKVLWRGRTAKSVAGGVDVTLNAAEYDNLVLEFTGALTGNIGVILPHQEGRSWLVFNNTSGAFSLTVKGAAGTGVAVTQGKRSLVYTDGTNFAAAITDAAGLGAQPLDPELSAIAALTSAADKGVYFTGSGVAGLFDLSSFVRTLTGLTTAPLFRNGIAAAVNNAYYLLRRAEATLPNGFDLGSLTTGLLKITVAGADAIPSTAVPGTDYQPAHPRVVALTDAATIAVNADTTDIGTLTIGGNRTLGAPSGTPVHGQTLRIEVTQDGTGGRTLAYNAIYAFSTALPEPTLSTDPDTQDDLLFQWDAGLSKWKFMAWLPGFS